MIDRIDQVADDIVNIIAQHAPHIDHEAVALQIARYIRDTAVQLWEVSAGEVDLENKIRDLEARLAPLERLLKACEKKVAAEDAVENASLGSISDEAWEQLEQDVLDANKEYYAALAACPSMPGDSGGG